MGCNGDGAADSGGGGGGEAGKRWPGGESEAGDGGMLLDGAAERRGEEGTGRR